MSVRIPLRRALPLAAAALAGALLSGPAHAASLTVRDADGSLWTVVEDPADDADDYLLKRQGPDRKPDLRFARNGVGTFTLGSDNDAPTSVRVDSTHRIWMVGSNLSGNQPQPVVARFTADGSADPRWGVQGKLQMSPSGFAMRPNDVLPLSDGSVLVAAETPGQGSPKAVLYHLKADGALDTSFGTGGIWQRPGSDPAAATSLAVGADGTVAVAVSVRGPKPSVEIWSLNDTPPSLVTHEALDDAADEEDLRTEWVANHWAVNTSGGPTGVVPPASLARRVATAAAVASTPSDAGQGGFNPFAADNSAIAAPAAPPETDDGIPWLWIGVAAALALGMVALLFARGRGAKPPLRQGSRR